MQNRTDTMRHLLSRNVEEVIERGHLEKALQSGKKLRVKLGIDPTSPDLHLGHGVVLQKLREFQDLGHKIVLIIGDFTAQIGDPSGRNETRPPLGTKAIALNEKKYLAQAGKVINVRKAEVLHNSKWFAKEGIARVIELASAGSMQQVLRRADFKKRLSAGQDITMLEIFYPLLQGYDSVKVRADVEIGGTDQLFNLLMGRRVQRHFGIPEQDVLTVPLLVGIDGIRKMSKSYKNYIGLDEEAGEMFGKVMALPDALMESYFTMCTDLPPDEILRYKNTFSPRDLKMHLGIEIVKRYHGEAAAKKAADHFGSVFSKRHTNETELPMIKLDLRPLSVLDLVFEIRTETKKPISRSEARRLVEQGGVKIDGITHADPRKVITPAESMVVQIGKKDFFRVHIK